MTNESAQPKQPTRESQMYRSVTHSAFYLIRLIRLHKVCKYSYTVESSFCGGNMPELGTEQIIAEYPSGKLPTTRVRRQISFMIRLRPLLVRNLLQCSYEKCGWTRKLDNRNKSVGLYSGQGVIADRLLFPSGNNFLHSFQFGKVVPIRLRSLLLF